MAIMHRLKNWKIRKKDFLIWEKIVFTVRMEWVKRSPSTWPPWQTISQKSPLAPNWQIFMHAGLVSFWPWIAFLDFSGHFVKVRQTGIRKSEFSDVPCTHWGWQEQRIDSPCQEFLCSAAGVQIFRKPGVLVLHTALQRMSETEDQ